MLAIIAATSTTTESGCRVWFGPRMNSGYGRLNWKPDGEPKPYYGAHRVSYRATVGHALPAGLVLDHLCRNRLCVLVEHLELVTPRTNVLRSPIALAAINAQKTHCPSGHEYTPDNLYATTGDGGRQCRACAPDRRLVKAGS